MCLTAQGHSNWESIMEREIISCLLLRELWRTYDHGGHSNRSWHAQLLETNFAYRDKFLRASIDSTYPSDLIGFAYTFPFEEVPEQFRLFPELKYASDTEREFIILCGLRRHYRTHIREYESRFVEASAHILGLPSKGGAYANIVEETDPYDLLVELRFSHFKMFQNYD